LTYANVPCRLLYSNARAKALKELYKSKELDQARPESIEADFEEVAASCGQFSFSLYDFGSEMQNLLSILEDLKQQTEKTKKRSWKWLKFWQRFRFYKGSSVTTDPEREPLIEPPSSQPGTTKDMPELVMGRRDSKYWKLSSQEAHPTGRFYNKLLHVMRVLERDDGWSRSRIFSAVCSHIISTLCFESWHWSCSICLICLHSGHPAILSTLARGMGFALIHVGVQHDHRSLKYHGMGTIYRHIHGSCSCHRNLGYVSR